MTKSDVLKTDLLIFITYFIVRTFATKDMRTSDLSTP